MQAVADITHGQGVQAAVDAVGNAKVFRQMLEMLGVRGHGVLVGAPVPGDEVGVDLNPSLGAGHRVSFVLEGDAQPHALIPELVRLHEAGLFPLDRIITTYPFSDINTAITDAVSGTSVKPVLTFS